MPDGCLQDCAQPLRAIDSAGGGLSSEVIGKVPSGTPCGVMIENAPDGKTYRDIQWQGKSGYVVCEVKR